MTSYIGFHKQRRSTPEVGRKKTIYQRLAVLE
jgi:hypothetical protein